MSRGIKRDLIPMAHSDIGLWPNPDVSVFDRSEREHYLRKREAVELYCAGESYSVIRERCGKCDEEVRRLVKRCITPDGQGGIFGFHALLKGVRLNAYNRTAQVKHSVGNEKGGCTGALGQLFQRFPEIPSHLNKLFFKQDSQSIVHEARISYTDLHVEFKKLLRAAGLTDDDWPFNTAYRGYGSLRNYFIQLRNEQADRSMPARSGREASNRTGIGKGFVSLLPLFRPFTYVQLDYHKVDAASIIVLRNVFDDEIEVPISRWHIGLLVEEYCQLVIGAFIALETTPSADSALETIERALKPEVFVDTDPRRAYIMDGKALPNQIIPELAFQSFSVLKVDNAWANSATEVLNTIIDTVGCAVNFGPVYAWWTRSLVENIFGQLTRRGLQRLPSTYGTGVADSRRTNPNSQSIKFRIMKSELVGIIYGCIQEYNEKNREGWLQFSSPLNAIRSAMTHPQSGFFLQPLPRSAQQDVRLMAHIEECIVHGNIAKNVRPYFLSDRCRYTNETLSNSYWLLGKTLIVSISRRDCRVVTATVKETGQDLGMMIPERSWAQAAISWRDRKFINRSGLAKQHASEAGGPVHQWKANKAQEIMDRHSRKKKNQKTSKAGLDLARLESDVDDYAPELVDKDRFDQIKPPGPVQDSDPFGFSSIPEMKPISKR